VTYNFDPDRWLGDRKAALEVRFGRGELDEGAFQGALEELERRYDEMIRRLDGTFHLPQRGPQTRGAGK
jgi:hypothetical protein